MSLGENIRRLRRRSGLQTQKALADLLNVPQPQVSNWENDRYSILETMTLVKIAKGLRCSVDALLAGVDPDYDRVREARGEPARVDSKVGTFADIPVVVEGDTLPEGLASDAPEAERTGVVQWVSRPADLRDPNAYGVRIRGDSMIPAYRPNTIAIVAPSRGMNDGDDVYVLLGTGERLVRQAQSVPGGCLLQSYNHSYEALLVPRKDIRAMEVVVSSRLAAF